MKPSPEEFEAAAEVSMEVADLYERLMTFAIEYGPEDESGSAEQDAFELVNHEEDEASRDIVVAIAKHVDEANRCFQLIGNLQIAFHEIRNTQRDIPNTYSGNAPDDFVVRWASSECLKICSQASSHIAMPVEFPGLKMGRLTRAYDFGSGGLLASIGERCRDSAMVAGKLARETKQVLSEVEENEVAKLRSHYHKAILRGMFARMPEGDDAYLRTLEGAWQVEVPKSESIKSQLKRIQQLIDNSLFYFEVKNAGGYTWKEHPELKGGESTSV